MLMWPSNDAEVKILLDELQNAGHEIVYWVGERAIEHLNTRGSIFHDHYDAWDAVRAEALKDAEILPADPTLIESMFETESLILTMMNKRYDRAPVDERKHIYYTMLAYWDYVLTRTKPDVVIYNTVPHSIYTNIVYDLTKNRGLATLMFEETWVGGRLMFYKDFWHGSDEIREAIREMEGRALTPADLDPELREYYEHQKDPRGPKSPWYMQRQRAIGTGSGLWMHRARIVFRAPHLIFSRAFGLLARSMRANLRNEYEAIVQKVGLSQPYVYFPLNFQPERTTSPQGGIFHDQILAAELLAAALPEGWQLYVKEHPSQWWLRGKTRFSSARYSGYYARLAQIRGVRVVPIHTDTFTLTDRAKLVATVTGTAGLEALVRGKHALVLGFPWYRDCPGVLMARSVGECKEAFALVEGSPGVPERDVLSFLKALEKTGTRAHLVPTEGVRPYIPMTESMHAIAERLIGELQALKKA
ncbi:hypothetical protein HYW60_03190 [Candidatus Kaiserbacteria bacterium]|nr:hypothetical protein [Candidatus Kaiserbacteria bacterium]